MSDNTSGSNNGFVYFIVGALVAVVAGFGVYYFGGFEDTPSDQTDFSITVGENGIEADD